ncbi:hypothetical protein RLR00_000780 [Salmonella enterica subsp. enterica serovar Muenchen]|nr:hypothetical protein [Salmonella enterica subsp. enterica serovar Muenchen]
MAIMLRVRGKRYRRKLIKSRPLFRKRYLRSLISTKSSNAYRKHTKNFYRDNDVLGISLFVMAVAGVAVGATAFAVAVGIVLFGYLIVTRRKTKSVESVSDSADAIKLREWDEHVKNSGGYSGEDWMKAMKNRENK